MPTKLIRIGGVTLRVLLALLFVLSAVAKLFAIDDFELYVFSYGLLPLDLCFIIARLCIGAELALALLIAVGRWRRWVNLAALLILVAFSLFLCYAMIVGRTDSCQCFGRLADMPPAVSLLKNAVLIALVLVYMKIGGMEKAGAQSLQSRFLLSWEPRRRWRCRSRCRCLTIGCMEPRRCALTELLLPKR